MAKRKGNFWTTILLILLLLAGAAWFIGRPYYSRIYKPNIKLAAAQEFRFVYIRSGSSFADVERMFNKEGIMPDTTGFGWLSRQMHYTKQVKPGRYRVFNGMNNLSLIRMLRAGLQIPVDISLHDIRFKEEIAGLFGRDLEADSVKVMELLNDRDFLSGLGFTPENAMAMFIDNTYKFDWNTTSEAALKRMFAEYKKVWSGGRSEAAAAMNMSEAQIMTLASIVQEETRHKEEAPKIAQVYLNRLKADMKLQADPTAKYALLSFDKSRIIHRIYLNDLLTESDYNTYLHKGLPPGPIVVTATWAIDAVLHPEVHDYLFFVASVDRKGYHEFSKTYKEHSANSKKYSEDLNKRQIK
jgi:UPF0755 protein